MPIARFFTREKKKKKTNRSPLERVDLFASSKHARNDNNNISRGRAVRALVKIPKNIRARLSGEFIIARRTGPRDRLRVRSED